MVSLEIKQLIKQLNRPRIFLSQKWAYTMRITNDKYKELYRQTIAEKWDMHGK